MAILHADGFAQYVAAGATSTTTHKMDVLYGDAGSSSVALGTDYAPDGRVGMSLSGGHGPLLTLSSVTPATPAYADLWTGMRIYKPSQPHNIAFYTSPFKFIGAFGGTLWVNVYGDGTVRFIRGSTQVGPSAVGFVPVDAFHWIECHARIHDSTGFIEVKCAGQTYSFSGDTASFTGDTTITQIQSWNTGGTAMYCSDYVISDSAYTGDIMIPVGFAVADGFDVSALTKIGAAASKYQSVNERPHDGDTTAVDLTAAGRGLFSFGNAGTVAPIAIAVHQVARKVGTGAATLKTKVRSGGSEASVGSHVLADTYKAYEDVMELNPVTAAAWAASAAIELGPER